MFVEEPVSISRKFIIKKLCAFYQKFYVSYDIELAN